mmetsp:Transcript_123469/g.348934  ORF Transcript_123469/g.348934 Transcript_123469/m.348934 type:complete len:170 (+) Transcript_123469:125-634(+)
MRWFGRSSGDGEEVDEEEVQRLMKEAKELAARATMKESEKKKENIRPQPQRQLPPEAASQLVQELSPQLREELAQVLKEQDKPEGERRGISPQLAKVLRRYQNRWGLGLHSRHFNDGDETWPMYLGIALFMLIFGLMTFIWIQETFFAQEEKGPNADEDPYWWRYGEEF